MAHFVIGWLRNTSYYLFGSGSSGLGIDVWLNLHWTLSRGLFTAGQRFACHVHDAAWRWAIRDVM